MSLFGSYNRVTLLGRMTRDVEVKTIPSGAQVGNFSIAISESVKRGDKWEEVSHFFDCQAWQKNAEWLQRFGGKGKLVLVEGTLRQERWEDKASGQKRSAIRINVENVTFVDGGGGGGEGGGSRGGSSKGGGRGDYQGGYGGGGGGGKPKSNAQPYRSNFDDVPDSSGGDDGAPWEGGGGGDDVPWGNSSGWGN